MAHFSANNVVNTIVTTLEAYDSDVADYPFRGKCHNHFGDDPANWEHILTQNEHIYVFYRGTDHEPLANYQTTGRLYIELWVIDLVKATASNKSDFQADNLRAYLCSDDWRTLGLDVEYPAMNIRPFFVESDREALILNEKGQPTGYIWTVFRGYCGFDSSMSS